VSARAVFLDRDGVLNQALVREGKPYPPANLDQVIILPGVREALHHLKSHEFLLIVVTNQPDIARGTLPLEEVERIDAFLAEELPLNHVYVCPHDNQDACICRKPRPGLLLQAAQDFDIDLARSYMIGDRWRDIEAGRAAGCTTFFIDYDYRERRPESPDFTVRSLHEAAHLLTALHTQDKRDA